ncbi:hypothetical protein [Limnoglobus roseus]|nr:hypothetical protein [Limnoglobus roseus]
MTTAAEWGQAAAMVDHLAALHLQSVLHVNAFKSLRELKNYLRR